jgi:hypothetical protein
MIKPVAQSDGMHQSMACATRSTAACVALLVSGCIEPKQDFDDWLAKTADARGGTNSEAVDAEAFDGAAPDGGFSGAYFMACLPNIARGDATQSLRFQVAATFTASSGGNGMLDFHSTPVPVSATDLSQTVGSQNGEDGAVVSNLLADVVYGQLFIPAVANKLGNDVTFSDLTLHVHLLSSSQFCGVLSGHVIKPVPIDLTGPGSFCIMQMFAQPSGPLPMLTAQEFHCP